MPDIKKSRVPLPLGNPSKNPKLSESRRRAPPLSKEVVVESDSEDVSGASSSGRSSGSESNPAKRGNTKTPNPQKAQETEPASPQVPDDSSEGEDDDVEDDDHKIAASDKASAKPSGLVNG
ncbi:hypothetical protein LTR66_011178, partial [Elasticomyces elasticus]